MTVVDEHVFPFLRQLGAEGSSYGQHMRDARLGSHRSGRITTHYSAAELSRLLEAANSGCERKGERPELVVLRRLSTS